MSRRTLAVALLSMSLAGCSFLRSEGNSPGAGGGNPVVAASYTGKPGKLVVPRLCKLDSAVVIRPVGHAAIDEAAWRVADEQVVPLDVRHALEANGLRVGVITGNLPAEILDAFGDHPPLKTTEWVHFDLPESTQTPITVRPKATASADGSGPSEPEVATLLVNHHGKVEGKEYADAGGIITVTADHKGGRSVSLRVVPSIQHGPKLGQYNAIQNAGPFAQQEFTFRSEQKEDSRRDLAVTLDIEPGQYVVIGCRSGRERSLGSFLFTRPDAQSNQVMQSLLLIQAGRNNVGAEPPKPDGEDKAREPEGIPARLRIRGPKPLKNVPKFEAVPTEAAAAPEPKTATGPAAAEAKPAEEPAPAPAPAAAPTETPAPTPTSPAR